LIRSCGISQENRRAKICSLRSRRHCRAWQAPMPMRPINRWAERRRRTVERADAITAKVGRVLPIDLRCVANECGVREVRFQALLLDGGLAIAPDGFHIYVRADAELAPEFTRRFNEDGTG